MKILLSLAVFINMILMAPVMADQHTATAQCAQKYQSCQQQCNSKYTDDGTSKAGCLAKCSAGYAACDAAAAYEKAKPWLDQQTEKAKKFWDELMKDSPENAPINPEKNSKDKSI